MNTINSWGEMLSSSLMDAWSTFISFIPALLGALIVFIAGVIIARLLGGMVSKITKSLKLDKLLNTSVIKKGLNEADVEFDLAGFLGGLVKWFLILVSLMAASDILGLDQITEFLNNIIFYIPNVLVATIILAVAFLVANFVSKVTKSSIEASGIKNGTVIATVAKWSIVVFGFLAAFVQLGIAVSLAEIIMFGVIGGISLAFGIAFGLGGKEEAARILRKIREDAEHN